MRGHITTLKLDRGFGFICPAEPGPDCFFHFRQLVGLEFDEQLTGRRVEYDVTTHPRTGRPCATNVRAVG